MYIIVVYSKLHYNVLNGRLCIVSMALCKTAVTPLPTHWSYCNLALSHRYQHRPGRFRKFAPRDEISWFPVFWYLQNWFTSVLKIVWHLGAIFGVNGLNHFSQYTMQIKVILLMFSLWYLQMIGYIMACRSCSFVCKLHHLIIIIMQTYLKALNY